MTAPAEQGAPPRFCYVTIDGDDIYPCVAAVDATTGELQRWNGFVAYPLFTRSVAERIVRDFTKDLQSGYIEPDRYVWEGDDLLRFRWNGEPSSSPDNDEYGYTREVIRPTTLFTPDPRYCIGGYEFTWAVEDVEQVIHRCTRSDAHTIAECEDYPEAH